MIPFHKIYAWLFKSFSIDSEITLIDRLTEAGYNHIMLVKRSWIFILFVLWMPLFVFLLSLMSIWIAFNSIDEPILKYTIVIGNILMSTILIFSSFSYIRHFRQIHGHPKICTDMEKIKAEIRKGDNYFVSFFNWSLTNQLVLIILFFSEIILVFMFQDDLGQNFWLLLFDTIVIIVEFIFLSRYRKKMIDLEMDYNVIIPGKIFFVNQSGVLSDTQTLESDKIKTVRAKFPSKISSFFNYGNIDVLTEGDSAMIGVMTMYYVTDPNGVVAKIQKLLAMREMQIIQRKGQAVSSGLSDTGDESTNKNSVQYSHDGSSRHALDTREKIRDVLR